MSRRRGNGPPPVRRDDRTVLIVCNHFGTLQAHKGPQKVAQLTIFGFDHDADTPVWEVRVLTRNFEARSSVSGKGSAFRYAQGSSGRMHRTWRLSCDRCPIDAVATDKLFYEKIIALRDTGMSPV